MIPFKNIYNFAIYRNTDYTYSFYMGYHSEPIVCLKCSSSLGWIFFPMHFFAIYTNSIELMTSKLLNHHRDNAYSFSVRDVARDLSEFGEVLDTSVNNNESDDEEEGL
ncbi:hypothetical protein RF11_07311 [Thelohanellus kitauei]|uniref:CULT domain-containing protein n=1 Tax=Thelohanellus kitauei TaxID=669202 RepID=A0A0C2IQF7_THEKT|nr:hypothetical protein RF11_07311 [Thelohanellus kitauei]